MEGSPIGGPLDATAPVMRDGKLTLTYVRRNCYCALFDFYDLALTRVDSTLRILSGIAHENRWLLRGRPLPASASSLLMSTTPPNRLYQDRQLKATIALQLIWTSPSGKAR